MKEKYESHDRGKKEVSDQLAVACVGWNLGT